MASSCPMPDPVVRAPPPGADLWQAFTVASQQLNKRKSIILGLIGIAFIVIIFWKVIPQIGSYSDAWNALQSMSHLAFALIIFMVLVYLMTYGFPFMAATPGLKYWQSQQLNEAAFAISNGVPGGGAVGLAVQLGMLTSYGVAGAPATAAITAVGLWSSFVTLGFPILGVIALIAVGGNGGAYAYIGLIGLAVLVTVVVAFVLVMRSQTLARSIGRLGNRLLGPLRGRISALRDLDLVGPITTFRSNMYELLKRRWATITVAQVAVSGTQFLVLFVALRGIEGWDKPGTSMGVVFAAFAISQVGLLIPITPGGLGTVDAAMIAIMVALGVQNGNATAADLVWRASSYVPQIIVGILALVSWYRRAGKTFATAKSTAG